MGELLVLYETNTLLSGTVAEPRGTIWDEPVGKAEWQTDDIIPAILCAER